MITLRRAEDRGTARFGWLTSRHSFSFGYYFDPAHMGFGPLRVINEDRVDPGRGFDTHGHQDMEIISYVLGGALEHKDSLGTGSVIRPGDVQRMSAGTGIRHSEYNHSTEDPVHFLQIWILPERDGLKPGYEQKSFSPEDAKGRFRLVGSRDGRDGSVTIHQDVDLYDTHLQPGDESVHDFKPGRIGWLQIARGQAELNGEAVRAGDGVAISGEDRITLTAREATEALLFDMKP